MQNRVKTPAEIEAMRESGRILAAVLDVLKHFIKPGMTTMDLELKAREELQHLGGEPAFLGYQNYPAVLCVSVNDEVVHGIPGAKVIEEGDIVGMDFGVVIKGMVTDGAISVIVGEPVSARDKALLQTTEKALMAAIAQVKNGAHIGDLAAAAQNVMDKAGVGIVRDLVGHGVGHELHEEPNVPNYGSRGSGPALRTGMTIAIEPMATLGGHDVFIAPDRWTVKTRDGSRSAHFEHTVLVTEDGAEILTLL
jgi:methionyl aminopeptidase